MKKVFRNYCIFGKSQNAGAAKSAKEVTLNGWQFSHLCKDAGFVQPIGGLHSTDVDVIFAKCKPVGVRHLTYKVDCCQKTIHEFFDYCQSEFQKMIGRGGKRKGGFEQLGG